MKTLLAMMLASAIGAGSALAGNAPIAPDFVAAAPRMNIDRSLVASPAMNRIEPLDVVSFDTSSAHLSGETVAQVDTAAKWLRRHGDHKIVLEGHTDRAGASLYNEDLATRRMAAVRNRLMGWGISPDRIIMVTYGEREAMADLNDADRRVVLFATQLDPRAVIAMQLHNRDVIVATWTDRGALRQLEPGGNPPIERRPSTAVSRR